LRRVSASRLKLRTQRNQLVFQHHDVAFELAHLVSQLVALQLHAPQLLLCLVELPLHKLLRLNGLLGCRFRCGVRRSSLCCALLSLLQRRTQAGKLARPTRRCRLFLFRSGCHTALQLVKFDRSACRAMGCILFSSCGS